jgi:hypothetical protein
MAAKSLRPAASLIIGERFDDAPDQIGRNPENPLIAFPAGELPHAIEPAR